MNIQGLSGIECIKPSWISQPIYATLMQHSNNLQGPYCMCVNRYSSLGSFNHLLSLCTMTAAFTIIVDKFFMFCTGFFYCFTQVCLCSTLQPRFSSLQLLAFSTVKNCHWDGDEIKKATKQLSAILKEHFFKKVERMLGLVYKASKRILWYHCLK